MKWDSDKTLGYRIIAGNEVARQELIKRRTVRENTTLLTWDTKVPFTITITDEIKEMLTSIQEKYNILDVTNIADRANEQSVSEALSSCQVEGAVVTLAETLEVLSGKRADTKSKKMVVNTLDAIQELRLMNTVYPNLQQMCKLWHIVTKDVCENEDVKGEPYRTGSIIVGSDSRVVYQPPLHQSVPGLMESLYNFALNNEYSPLIAVSIIHFYFVYIHPFCDGNGRVVRLLVTNYLVKNGYEKFERISLTTSIQKYLLDYYYTTILECEDSKDLTSFIVYYLDVIDRTLDAALDGFNPRRNFIEHASTVQTKIMKQVNEQSKYQITVSSCAKKFKLSLEEAEKELSMLCKHHVLMKVNQVYVKYSIDKLNPRCPQCEATLLVTPAKTMCLYCDFSV